MNDKRGDLADAVIVIERDNPDFRKMGRIEKFEIGGEIVVRMSNEKEIHIPYEGHEKTIKVFYRHKNKKGKELDELKPGNSQTDGKWYERVPQQFGRGPVSLFETYYELGNPVSDFFKDYAALFGKYPI